MSNFILNIEILAGTDIEDAIQEAKHKCNLFDLAYVSFKFNGISVSVGKEASVSKGAVRVMDAMRTGVGYVVENGRP